MHLLSLFTQNVLEKGNHLHKTFHAQSWRLNYAKVRTYWKECSTEEKTTNALNHYKTWATYFLHQLWSDCRKKRSKVCYQKTRPIGKKKTLDALIKTTYNALKAKQSSTPDFTTCKKKKKDATETRTTWSLSVQKEKKTDVTKNTVTIKNFIFFEANIFFLSSLLSCTSRVFKLSMSCAHLSRPKT